MSASASAAELEAEVTELAQALIRIDTSNPPGAETPAAELVAEHLGGAGVHCELVGPDPERLNLIARIKGTGGGPSILLMAHTDVVPAPDALWSVPPFAAEVREGLLFGRGAADMKGELAARAVAMAAFARGGVRPRGDVVLVAEADEERNTADVGMSWLVRERPDLACDFALNESGGLLLELSDGRRFVTLAIGEKQVTSLRLRVFGTAGHASVPTAADNPVRRAAVAIEALAEASQPLCLEGAAELTLEALGISATGGEQAVAEACRLHPWLEHRLPAMTRMTITPTGFRSYEPANVIPPYADVICDCRAMPGEGEAEIRDAVERAVGGACRYELELLEPLAGGTTSPVDTELYRLLEAWVSERLPGAALLPLTTPGFTDSHWVRQASGTVAYGFAPVLATDLGTYLDGIHGADEAVATADLGEMAACHLSVLEGLALSGSSA